MAEPAPVEIAQKVVVERASVLGGAAPSDVLVGSAINAMKDARQEAGLNIAANKESNQTVLTGLRDQNIGYTDENGIKQEDAARKDRAKTRQDLYHEFSGKNLDDLTIAQQNLLIGDTAQVIKNLPGMQSHFASLPPGTDIDAIASQMANARLRGDPAFKKAMIDLFLNRNDVSKPIEDQVTVAVAKEAELKKQRDDLEKRNKDSKDNIEEKEKQLKEHQAEVGKGKSKREGRTFQQINTLNGETTTLQSEIEGLKLDETQFDSDLQGFNKEMQYAQAIASGNIKLPAGQAAPRSVVDVQSSIGDTKKELAKTRGEIAKRNGEIEQRKKKITNLEANESKIEEELSKLKKEQKQVEDEFTKTDSAYNTKKAEVTKLKALKILAEETWVLSLESITREAATTYINSELGDALAEVKVLQVERAKNEKEEGKKAFWSYESQQYIGPDGRPIRANIDTDRATLMAQTAQITFNLADNSTPTLLLNGAEQTLANVMTRSRMTIDQVYNLLKDPATRTEMSGTLAQDILTTHLWSGGKLSRGEIVAIHRSEWGKGMVAKALAGRADLKAQVDGMIGKGVLNWNENIAAQLGKIDWAKFALILLVIAGIVGGIGLLKK